MKSIGNLFSRTRSGEKKGLKKTASVVKDKEKTSKDIHKPKTTDGMNSRRERDIVETSGQGSRVRASLKTTFDEKSSVINPHGLTSRTESDVQKYNVSDKAPRTPGEKGVYEDNMQYYRDKSHKLYGREAKSITNSNDLFHIPHSNQNKHIPLRRKISDGGQDMLEFHGMNETKYRENLNKELPAVKNIEMANTESEMNTISETQRERSATINNIRAENVSDGTSKERDPFQSKRVDDYKANRKNIIEENWEGYVPMRKSGEGTGTDVQKGVTKDAETRQDVDSQPQPRKSGEIAQLLDVGDQTDTKGRPFSHEIGVMTKGTIPPPIPKRPSKNIIPDYYFRRESIGCKKLETGEIKISTEVDLNEKEDLSNDRIRASTLKFRLSRNNTIGAGLENESELLSLENSKKMATDLKLSADRVNLKSEDRTLENSSTGRRTEDSLANQLFNTSTIFSERTEKISDGDLIKGGYEDYKQRGAVSGVLKSGTGEQAEKHAQNKAPRVVRQINLSSLTGAGSEIKTNKSKVFLQMGDQIKQTYASNVINKMGLYNLFLQNFPNELNVVNNSEIPKFSIWNGRSNIFEELSDYSALKEGSVIRLNHEWEPNGGINTPSLKSPVLYLSAHQGDVAPERRNRDFASARTAPDENIHAIRKDIQDLKLYVFNSLQVELASKLEHVLKVRTEELSRNVLEKYMHEETTSHLNRNSDSGSSNTQIGRSSIQGEASQSDNSATLKLVEDAILASKSKEKEIENLKKENQALMAKVNSLNTQVEVSSSNIKRLEEQLNKAHNQVESLTVLGSERQQSATSEIIHPGRVSLNDGKLRLKTTYNDLALKMTDSEILINELRKDVVARGSIPSQDLLDKSASELAFIKTSAQDLAAFISSTCDSWKKTWEYELKNIVSEQQFVKHVNGELSVLLTDVSTLEDVLGKINQVIELKTSQNYTKRIPMTALHVVDAEDRDLLTAARSNVLTEIQLLNVNHQQRVDALEQSERLRKLTADPKESSEFGKELASFVDSSMLKQTELTSSGGYSEFETKLQEKNDKILKEMFQNNSKKPKKKR
ncbi:Bud site selection protein 6 [Zancudomyces culisetae]|uniref:Bud site selection protein 6 n=1 Tax=Zancudomyces culisetae TaxID=1213189 RepID=A0A1R1PXV8_ZANCU|nr:Bud site selection protein 6 [Zancudomyces culisetae]|eukprot:OMH85811.1 Bud site selection protein 6 [Zancudomyces culisetae]